MKATTPDGWEVTAHFTDDKQTRRCGGCTLCCRLLPVERNLAKPAGERCRYQCSKGCRVYADLERVSPSCREWSCRWLVDTRCAGMRRPDRVHYVIDIVPDFIGVQKPEGGEVHTVPVIQVWCDPNYPDAHRDPGLRAYIARLAAEEQTVALVRYGSAGGAILLAPPSTTEDGQWLEQPSTLAPSDAVWRNPLKDVHEMVEKRRQEALKL